MKESMWGYLIIALGLIIVVVLFIVQNLTNTNEQDYYLSREILRASMYDAIDYGTYMKSGKLVMSREKFVSVFTRRFAESVNPDRTYQLDFYDIYEYPPKATIRIKTNTGEVTVKNSSTDIEINTFITGILETTESTGEFNIIYSTSTGDWDNDGNFSEFDLSKIINFLKNNKNRECNGHESAIDANGDSYCDNQDLILLKKALYNPTPLDANGDGEFTDADVKLVRDCIKDNNCSSALSPKGFVAADATNDGYVNEKDLEKMSKALQAS